jgi:large subunit ribosomal protein L24
MKIRKGDTVQVLTGSDKGKQGRVLKVVPKTEKLLVEGVRMVKKHLRPTQDTPQGGIQEKESLIHYSNLHLVVDGNPTKVGYRILEDGKKVRYAKKTGEIID